MKAFLLVFINLFSLIAFAENQITIDSRACLKTVQETGKKRDAILRSVGLNDNINTSLELQMRQLSQAQAQLKEELNSDCEKALGSVAVRLLFEMPANATNFENRLDCIQKLVEIRDRTLTAEIQKSQMEDEEISTLSQSLLRERRANRSYSCALGIQSPELIELLFQQF